MTIIGWGVGALTWGQESQAVPPEMAYLFFCATCHGKTGAGDGPQAASLSGRPRDFADCAAMSKISDETIVKVIKYGGAPAGLNSDMPGFAAAMSDDEIKSLAQYVRTFCGKK